MISHLRDFSDEWSKRTIEDLRVEAVLSDMGIAYSALGVAGKRWCMAVCVTGDDGIRRMLRVFHFADDANIADRYTLTLASMLDEALAAGGMTYEPLHGEDGALLALVLMVAVPETMRIVENLFGLTP